MQSINQSINQSMRLGALNSYRAEFKLMTIKPIKFNWLNGLDAVSPTVINTGVKESAGQDQTARMCSLILLYTLHRLVPRSRTAGKRLRPNL